MFRPLPLPPLILLLVLSLTSARADDARAAPDPERSEPQLNGEARAPELVRKAFPKYPKELRDQGVGGDVVLDLSLDETGRPYAVAVVSGTHPELDAAAEAAAKRLLFRPATINGEPHPSQIQYRFTFSPSAADHEAGTENVAPNAADPKDIGDGITIVDTRPWRVFKQIREATIEGAAVGTYRFGRRDLELTPGAVSDVNMVIHTLPSVSRSSFFVGNFSIRGGAPEETVTYLDGVRLNVPDIQGLLSRFNPNLVEDVTIHAGSQPSQFGESVAGVLAIRYSDPQNDRFHALVDLNLLTLSGQVSGPIGKKGSPVSFVFSARRALLDLYLAIIELTGLYDGLKFGYGDAFGRVHVDIGNAGNNVIDLSVLWADAHITHAPEGAVPRVERKNNLLVSLRHKWTPSSRIRGRGQIALTWEEDKDERGEALLVRAARLRPSARADVAVGLFKATEFIAGVDFEATRKHDTGAFFDVRRRPTWVESAWADDLALRTELDTLSWHSELGIYGELVWKSFLNLPIEGRVGVRATPLNATGVPTISPRAALALRLKSGTTFKVHGGITHQYPTQQGVYDPVLGAKDPQPGQALTVAGSIEQSFKFGLNLRFEAYNRTLRNLLVWPDSDDALAAGGTFETVGSGFARGFDLSVGMRTPNWGVWGSYSFLSAERTNPLNTEGPTTYEPWFSTPHGLKVGGDFRFGRRRDWIFSAGLQMAQGRPFSPVRHTFDRDSATWMGDAYDYGAQRHGWQNALSVRLEHRRVYFGRLKLSVYIDLANIQFDRNMTVMRVRDTDYDLSDRPSLPELFDAARLPVLPWVGVRGEL